MLVSTPPAAARTVLGPVPDESEASAVTANALTYAFDGEYESFGVFRRGANGKVQRLRQFDSMRSLRAPRRDADESERVVELDASPSLVAVAVSRLSVFYEGAGEFSEDGQSAIAVARPRGPARRVVQCARFRLGPVAVDDSVVAYLGAGCRGWIGALDVSSGRARILPPSAGAMFGELDVAGRYVAAEETRRGGDQRLVVYDWVRGGRVLDVPAGLFALGRDGTLAVLRGAGDEGCDAAELVWYSVKEPRAHVLPGACGEELFIARGQVLWSRRLPGAGVPEPRLEYVATSLSTGDTQVLFEGGVSQRWPVYFDGDRVAYAVPGCDGTPVVAVDTVAALRQRAPLAVGPCTVSLGRIPRSVRVDERGEFKLEFGSRTGCEGSISLYSPSEQREIALYGGNSRGIVVEPGRRSTAVVSLATEEAQRLAAAGRLDVELRVLVFQPDGGKTTRSVPLTLLPRA
jgi:hypothetical protein